MLEIGKIKNHSSEIIKSLQKRGIDVTDDLSELLNLNQKRITNQQKLDLILTDSNQIAQHIGQLAKEQKFSTIDKLKTKASINANNVWSLPMPTFSPALCTVPLCLMIIFPAIAFCPP